MILIGENVHIISKKVRSALENRDENFVKKILKIQQKFDVIDLNVGPAKGKLDNIFQWLIPLCGDKNLSLDTSNIAAIKEGLKLIESPKNCFINSTSADKEKLEFLTTLAIDYDCNLIALAMSKETGIPKTADERMELICEVYDYSLSKGVNNEKLFFDPLVLPVKVDSSQGIEVLNTIKMAKESFDPQVKTVIGLSNISNGILSSYRPLFNRVFAVLAYGAGLDCIIADARDEKLYNIIKMLECNNPKTDVEKLYINLANMVQCFGELEDIDFDMEDEEQNLIIKSAQILLNKRIYSDSFAQLQ